MTIVNCPREIENEFDVRLCVAYGHNPPWMHSFLPVHDGEDKHQLSRTNDAREVPNISAPKHSVHVSQTTRTDDGNLL